MTYSILTARFRRYPSLQKVKMHQISPLKGIKIHAKTACYVDFLKTFVHLGMKCFVFFNQISWAF